MIVGEIANFVAYVFAPAVLVTPLGALSIIVRYNVVLLLRREDYFVEYNLTFFSKPLSAVLAHFLLGEQLQKLGVLGCISCIVGSVVIVLHAPQEHSPSSIDEIWMLATEPGICI